MSGSSLVVVSSFRVLFYLFNPTIRKSRTFFFMERTILLHSKYMSHTRGENFPFICPRVLED